MRRFTLVDAMIIVAAMAFGTFAIRETFPGIASVQAELKRATSSGYRRFFTVQTGLSVFIPYLATLTPAVAIIRLRAPRPRLRRVVRQPGMVACTVATTAMAIEAVWIASLFATGSRFFHSSTVFVGYTQQVSFAVAGAWIALAMSGRWRPEPSWVDRLGRTIGVVWIAATIINWSSYYLV